MFTEHLVGGRHYCKHFTCIDLFNLHKMLRNRHYYYYPCLMHGGAERLNKGHSDLDLVLTPRRNGSTGGLVGAGMEL